MSEVTDAHVVADVFSALALKAERVAVAATTVATAFRRYASGGTNAFTDNAGDCVAYATASRTIPAVDFAMDALLGAAYRASRADARYAEARRIFRDARLAQGGSDK
jgi:hypothetical protein